MIESFFVFTKQVAALTPESKLAGVTAAILLALYSDSAPTAVFGILTNDELWDDGQSTAAISTPQPIELTPLPDSAMPAPTQDSSLPVPPTPEADPDEERARMLALVEQMDFPANTTVAKDLLIAIIVHGKMGITFKSLARILHPELVNDERISKEAHKYHSALNSIIKVFQNHPNANLIMMQQVRPSDDPADGQRAFTHVRVVFSTTEENDSVDHGVGSSTLPEDDLELRQDLLDPQEFSLPPDFDVDAFVRVVFKQQSNGPSADLLRELIRCSGTPHTIRELVELLYGKLADAELTTTLKNLSDTRRNVSHALQRTSGNHGFRLVESSVPSQAKRGSKTVTAYSLVYTPPADGAILTDDLTDANPPEPVVKKK